MNQKKTICAIACFCLLLFAGARLAGAQETEIDTASVAVIDDASVLMEEEIDWIKEVASDLAEDSGWQVVAATCGDAGSKSSREICEEYFVSYAGEGDGISCLIDTDNQKMELVATGAAKDCFSKRKTRSILQKADEALGKKDYAQCFFLVLLEAREAHARGGQNPLAIAGAALAVALIVAGGAFWFENITKTKKNEGNDTKE